MRPELRPYWLAERAALWCLVLSRTSDTSRFGEQDILREIETHLYGAHMSVLALSHINRCLTHLERLGIQFSGEIAQRISEFRTEYNSPNAKIQEARDALEHEENRVSRIDLGKWPPYEGDLPDPRITGRKSNSPRLNMIRVLDRDYELGAVINAALALEQPLRDLASSLYPTAAPA